MVVTTALGHDIYQMELVDNASTYRTSGYIIKADKNVLIETGASPANEMIHKAFQELDLKPEQIDIIIVTHIHLDHAGGAGLLMSQCPNAKLFVHPKGKKHLADPGKLIAGAKQVYGNKFDGLFHPILPIAEKRIEIMEDQQKIILSNDRALVFMDTPGHAFHHTVIYDPTSQGFFAGDSVGIYFHRLFEQYGFKFCLPVSAPPQFQPEIMIDTLSRLADLKPERIYFTHYGMSEDAINLLNQAKHWTSFFGNDCVEEYQRKRSPEQLVSFIQKRVKKELALLGVPEDFSDADTLLTDIYLNVQGIVVYAEKLEKVDEKG